MSNRSATFDSKKMIRRLKKWHAEYRDLYNNGPLIGVLDRGVHIEPEFAETFAPTDQWAIRDRNDKDYPYEISTTVDGLFLFAIGTEQTMERFL